MFGIGRLLSREQRFRLIKYKTVQKLVVWKNRRKHPNPVYSLILFSRMFDTDWYLTEYPDVAVAKKDPILHYIEHGVHQKRNPSPWFNTKTYEEDHKLHGADNAFLHFLLNGQDIEVVDNYKRWREIYFPLNDERISEIRKEIDNMENKVLISIITKVCNPNIEHLQKAVESVKNQLYTNWELCIVGDSADGKEVKAYLKELGNENGKIKVAFNQHGGQTAAAYHSAIEFSTGGYLAFLDQDDELSLDALYEVAKVLLEKPHLSLIYTDEDKMDWNGELFDPHFKSDWNPMLFYSHNYLNHLIAVESSLCKKVIASRGSWEESQSYDFLLRCLEHIKEEEVHHIPKILYHWRSVEVSMSGDFPPSHNVVEDGKKALESHLQKKFAGATVSVVNKVFYKANFPLPENPKLVSLIIPLRGDMVFLVKCLESILQKTTYSNYEIIIIDNQGESEALPGFPDTVKNHPKVKIIKYVEPSNVPTMVNFAAEQANGEILLLMDSDVEIITEKWLTEMISYFAIKEVAVVGAKLLFKDDTIQHAGMVLGIGGVAGNPHQYLPSNAMGYMYRANLVQNVSAVSGACMAVRKSVFNSLGGLDVKLGEAFYDVDLCIKIREEGHKIVYTPFAQLYHLNIESGLVDNENVKKDSFIADVRYMQNKWRGILYCDPYYNPNLSLETENFQLAFPPAHIYGDLRNA